MNALWITRMAAYREKPGALESAKRLIAFKIGRESVFLRRYHAPPFLPELEKASSVGDILLVEARAARHFWRAFRSLLPHDTGFAGRVPGGLDPVNRLLDIGFHHLIGVVRGLLDSREMPADLGLLHMAHASNAAPLAYDLVELFRADTVDAEVLRYVRLKKKRLIEPGEKEVARFLARLNERLARPYYVASLGSCRTYRSYMLLQIEKFERAVDRGELFAPLPLPARHDTRC